MPQFDYGSTSTVILYGGGAHTRSVPFEGGGFNINDLNYPNTFGGSASGLPIYANAISYKDTKQYARMGEFPFVRTIHNANYDHDYTKKMGADEWRVMPYRAKTAAVSPRAFSGVCGLAVLK